MPRGICFVILISIFPEPAGADLGKTFFFPYPEISPVTCCQTYPLFLTDKFYNIIY